MKDTHLFLPFQYAISTIILILCIGPVKEVYANIPAAYLACEGALEKETCALPGPQYGVCVTDTLCRDPAETSVNECMICVDECWASEDGLACVRPWTGELGVCESQDRCTDKVETSFEECRRCIEGEPWIEKSMTTKATGCNQAQSKWGLRLKLGWLHLMICLMFLAYRIVLNTREH
jgi:hypothetical protein